MRFENWKIVFMEQRCQGTLRIWAEPFTPLRVPKLFNLRTDPFEYADITSNTYYDWFMRHDFFVFYTTAMATAVPGDVQGVPAAARTGQFQRRPGRREAARVPGERLMLESWNDGPTKSAIVDFVERVTTEGPDHVAPEARVAVFDNDGTLWCEKPMYIQLDFLLRRFKEQAEADPSLRDRQPYKAAYTGDLKWLGDAVTKHYQGDDGDFKVLVAAVLTAHHAITVEEHADRINAFFAEAKHPTLGRPYTSCGYAPMVELLRYLEANGFTNYIVSGGGRDFMRPITWSMYGIPPERVVGSSVGLMYKDDATCTPPREPEFFDDGPMKPVRLWSRIGRRPILAAGNSNGDIEMLQFTAASAGPSLQLLVLHDDADREFDYVAGAEKALELAKSDGWTVVGMKDDWTTIFA